MDDFLAAGTYEATENRFRFAWKDRECIAGCVIEAKDPTAAVLLALRRIFSIHHPR